MITLQNAMERLFIESIDEGPELMATEVGKVIALCRRCPGRIDPNDDSAGIIQTDSGALVMIVADGMGGGPLGHKASAIAVELIAEQLRGFSGTDLRPAILDGIEAANKAILDLEVGAATTLSVVEIYNGYARGYQVGDSQTLIIGQRGAMKWKSTPHSPVGYAVHSGMLSENEAMSHEDRHYVSNMVGSRSMHIDIGPTQKLSARDTVIVASDGLFDNLQLDEVIQNGRAGKPLQRVSQLAKIASQRMDSENAEELGKPDDLTILMFTR